MTKAVIFDMDGVLVDTESWFQHSFLDMLEANGVSSSEEEIRILTGCSEAFENEFLAQKLGTTPEKASKMKHAWIESHPVDYGKQARPGLKQTLDTLKAAGLKLAVASSSPMRAIKQMIGQCGLEGVFDVVVTGHDMPETKPDPAIYIHTLEKLGLDPSSVCAVEDSLFGVDAAKGAGLYVIGFHDPFTDLDLVKADTVIDGLPEIPGLPGVMSVTCAS